MENYIYSLTETQVEVLHNVARSFDIPLSKGFEYLPIQIYCDIKRSLEDNPEIRLLQDRLHQELLYPYSEESCDGNGFIILDNLFPKGINGKRYSSTELAPFDHENNRAYEFNTTLIEDQLKVYVVVGCLIGIPFRMFENKTMVIPVTSCQ